jgi:hypothetical protein
MNAFELDRLVVADVVDGSGNGARRADGGFLHHADGRLDDVVDVSEVAAHLSSIEHADRLTRRESPS